MGNVISLERLSFRSFKAKEGRLPDGAATFYMYFNIHFFVLLKNTRINWLATSVFYAIECRRQLLKIYNIPNVKVRPLTINVCLHTNSAVTEKNYELIVCCIMYSSICSRYS